MIDRGLKAQLISQSMVTGKLMIQLDFYPDKPARFVGTDGENVEIPTIPSRLDEIAKAIEETARKHKDEIAPCEFLAWKDESVEVKVFENEAGKRLIGPAGFNEICVANGAIYIDVVPSGVYTGINYMRAIAMGAAAAIENSADNLTYQVKGIKHLSDLNLEIPEAVRQHIEGQRKKIRVGGAVFVAIEAKRL